jgi:ATP-dependent DNA ligase
MQQATDRGTGALVYFAFDLLEFDAAPVRRLTPLERKKAAEEGAARRFLQRSRR